MEKRWRCDGGEGNAGMTDAAGAIPARNHTRGGCKEVARAHENPTMAIVISDGGSYGYGWGLDGGGEGGST